MITNKEIVEKIVEGIQEKKGKNIELIKTTDLMLQKDNEWNVFYDINFCPYCRTLILEEFDWRILNTEMKFLGTLLKRWE